jgi:hypothetical protein
MGPECGEPGGVKGIERFVFLFEPAVECGEAVGVVVADEGVAGLVVELPGGDVGVVGVVLAHRIDDFFAGGEEMLAIGAIAFAGAVVEEAFFVGTEHVGMHLAQPGRADGSGGAEDGGDAVLCGEVDGAVHPVEGEFAGGRFEFGPGEFAHAGDVAAEIGHLGEVVVPAMGGPLLGVVGGAEEEGRVGHDREDNRVLKELLATDGAQMNADGNWRHASTYL